MCDVEDTMQMKQTLLRGIMAGTLLLGPVAIAQANDTATTAGSERLEEKVEKALGQVDALRGVDVDVDTGVVTLKGEVASQAEKAKAERVAKNAGAKVVVNQLEIDADKAIARIKDRADAKKDRIDDQAAKAKDAVDRQTEVAKDRAERNLDPKTAAHETSHRDKDVIDPLVTAKVKTKIIRDDLLDKSDVNVDTDADGLVTLKGTVPSEAAKTRALELARTTDGVRKVVDHLTVKPAK
jgi:hyperosmotically inducible protein